MQCDVTDLQGNHCPEEAVHTVVFKGVETHLCERCHANVLAGAYGRQPTRLHLTVGILPSNWVILRSKSVPLSGLPLISPTASNANR